MNAIVTKTIFNPEFSTKLGMQQLAEAIPSVGREMLYQPSESIFGAVATSIVAHGWSVMPQRIYDRMPGRVHGAPIAWSREHDLRNTLPTPAALDAWNHQCATDNVALVFGPASGNVFALDIDVLNESMSSSICDIAEEVLGFTEFRRQGRFPKVALLYRHAADDVVPSTSKLFASIEDYDYGLEILGSGKLLTVLGRHHTTGQYFKWLAGGSLLTNTPAEVPLVTASQVADFMAAVNARFPFKVKSAGEYVRIDLRDLAAFDPATATGTSTEQRESGLHKIVTALGAKHRDEILSVHAEGKLAEKELVVRLTDAACALFAAEYELSGRWTASSLPSEAAERMGRWVAKIAATPGFVSPNAVVRAAPVVVAETSDLTDDIQPVLTGDLDDLEGAPVETDGLPVIRFEPGNIKAIVDAAEQALIQAKHVGVFQRAGRLVAIGEAPVEVGGEGRVMAKKILERGDYALAEDLSMSARFERFDARRRAFARIDVPMSVVHTLRERAGRWKLPVLAGLTCAPTLRADGSLLDQPGYDEKSGIFYDPQGISFPTVNEFPTREDAVEALGKLLKIVATFPFVASYDRAAALSAFLTTVARPGLPSAPVHGFTAPAAGTGKSLLVDTACVLATGNTAPITNAASENNFAETEKRIASALYEGDVIISIDNIEGVIGGPLLDSMLTQQRIKIRIPGHTSAPEVSSKVMLFLTGNNLVVYKDLVRRSIVCSLDAGVERPESRQFDNDVIADVLASRGELVAACLTIMRAYIAAGKPKQRAKPLGNFATWSSRVRDALLWLGEDDAVITQEKSRELDPANDQLSAVLHAWKACVGNRRLSVADVIDHATPAPFTVPLGNEKKFLMEAMGTVAGDPSGRINPRRFGRWLMSAAGKIVNGTSICRVATASGVAIYQLIEHAEVAALVEEDEIADDGVEFIE